MFYELFMSNIRENVKVFLQRFYKNKELVSSSYITDPLINVILSLLSHINLIEFMNFELKVKKVVFEDIFLKILEH